MLDVHNLHHATRAELVERGMARLPVLLNQIRDRVPVPAKMPLRFRKVSHDYQCLMHEKMCNEVKGAMYGDDALVHYPLFPRRMGQSTAIEEFAAAYAVAFPGSRINLSSYGLNSGRHLLENVAKFANSLEGVHTKTINGDLWIETDNGFSCVSHSLLRCDGNHEIESSTADVYIRDTFDTGVHSRFCPRIKHPAADVSDCLQSCM